ncbi:hypothetical protein K3495_g2440 [Podosphaera aphanis]|nr:hypothetical protein K3495_g2440 [Podosphaera aphanis]
MSSFESRVQDAITAFERNEFSSQRAAATDFGIPQLVRSKPDGAQPALFPFNRQKGLRNRFTLPTLKQRPTTPEPSSCKRKLDEIHTPRKPADVHASLQNFRDKNELTRGTTLFMRKVTKSIGEFQAQLAEKTIVNDTQALEIERLSASKKRKRISVNPNTQFSDIEAIKKA